MRSRYKYALVASGALAAAGALAWFAAGAVFCAATLHVQRKLGPAPAGAATVSIRASDGIRLSGWWMRAQRPTGRCVIVLPGIADSRVGSAGFAPMFLSDGYDVLTPDSRAHGESGGDLVTYGLMERDDVLRWLQWMKHAGCTRLYGLGESLGGSILIETSAISRDMRAIVAEAPFADLKDIAEYRVLSVSGWHGPLARLLAHIIVASGLSYARWFYRLDFESVSPAKAIAQASTPILLTHGTNDNLTPLINARRLFDANPSNTLWLVPGAVHTGAATVAPQEFKRRVLAWFAQWA